MHFVSAGGGFNTFLSNSILLQHFNIGFEYFLYFQALVIAFTSDFIPRMVYKYWSNEVDTSLKGYVDWTLASKYNAAWS